MWWVYLVPVALAEFVFIPVIFFIVDFYGRPFEVPQIRKAIRLTLSSALLVSCMSMLLTCTVAQVLSTQQTELTNHDQIELLESDITGMKNMLHAGLLFGTLRLFIVNRNLRYCLLLCWAFCLMSIALVPVLGSHVALLLRPEQLVELTSADASNLMIYSLFAGVMLVLFCAVAFQLPRVYKIVGSDILPDPNVILAPEDPVLNNARLHLKFALTAEAVQFTLQVLISAILRFPMVTMAPPSFMAEVIGAYSFALHRAFIIGTGYTGAEKGDLRLLKIFIFGNSIFAAFYVFEIGAMLYGDTVISVYGIVQSASQVVVLSISLFFAVRLQQRLLVVQEQLSTQPWFNLPTGLNDEQRPSLWIMANNKGLSRKSRVSFRFAAMSVWSVLAMWIAEAIWLVVLSYPSNHHDEKSPVMNVANLLRSLGDGLNFALHGVALFVFVYYRSAQNANVFYSRKMFYSAIHFSYGLYSLWQLVNLLVLNAGLFSATAVFLTVRSLVFLNCAHQLRVIKFERQGFDTDVIPEYPGQQPSRHESQNGIELSTMNQEDDQGSIQEDDQLLQVNAKPKELQQHSDMIKRFAALQTGVAYAFFAAISLLVIATLFVERKAMANMVMMTSSHSVAYGIAFHYLFIIAGYGVRAGQDVSVLFLDVFRNALWVVVPISFTASIGFLLMMTNDALMILSALATFGVFLVSVAAAMISWPYNSLILVHGYNPNASHM